MAYMVIAQFTDRAAVDLLARPFHTLYVPPPADPLLAGAPGLVPAPLITRLRQETRERTGARVVMRGAATPEAAS